MSRIFNPLKHDHPLIKDGDKCPYCNEIFKQGQRTILISAESKKAATMRAIPAHATCALKGAKTELGEIERIKDGDASPYPVITTDGKQYTLSEFGLE